MRLRLSFDAGQLRLSSPELRRSLFLVPDQTDTIADLEVQIARHYLCISSQSSGAVGSSPSISFPSPLVSRELVLKVNGFTVPSWQSVHVLRDDDEVCVCSASELNTIVQDDALRSPLMKKPAQASPSNCAEVNENDELRKEKRKKRKSRTNEDEDDVKEKTRKKHKSRTEEQAADGGDKHRKKREHKFQETDQIRKMPETAGTKSASAPVRVASNKIQWVDEHDGAASTPSLNQTAQQEQGAAAASEIKNKTLMNREKRQRRKQRRREFIQNQHALQQDASREDGAALLTETNGVPAEQPPNHHHPQKSQQQQQQQQSIPSVPTEQKDYFQFPEIKDPGDIRVGDVIAYQVFEMTSMGTPQVSPFKEAEVLELNTHKRGEQLVRLRQLYPLVIDVNSEMFRLGIVPIDIFDKRDEAEQDSNEPPQQPAPSSSSQPKQTPVEFVHEMALSMMMNLRRVSGVISTMKQ